MSHDGTLLLKSIPITSLRLLPSELDLRPRKQSNSDMVDGGSLESFRGPQFQCQNTIHLYSHALDGGKEALASRRRLRGPPERQISFCRKVCRICPSQHPL